MGFSSSDEVSEGDEPEDFAAAGIKISITEQNSNQLVLTFFPDFAGFGCGYLVFVGVG